MVTSQASSNRRGPVRRHDFTSCLKIFHDATKQIAKMNKEFEEADKRRRGNGSERDKESS